tara:strand:- start:1345 stop:1797 length:453 start_codon:yes stop_codon:yes gene_type:complete
VAKEKKLENEITLGMLIGQVHRLSTKRFVQNSHMHGLEISLDQWLVLGPIWKHDGISQKDIAEYCGKDKTSITKIIDTLEKKNLVVRVTDQLDHRVKRVVLSQKGRQLFLSALPVMAQTRDELRSGISDKEIEALKTILNKIYKNLNDIQ